MINQFFHVAWAHLRCDWYLITHGMWLGQCKYTEYDSQKGWTLIAASTGSIFAQTIKIEKEFFKHVHHKSECPITKQHQEETDKKMVRLRDEFVDRGECERP